MLTEPNWLTMSRKERLNEVGTEPPCPFCQKPRVLRSDYIRCNPCGVNWAMSEMWIPNYLSKDPRVARAEAVHMESQTPPTAEPLAEDAEEIE